ncbi:HAD family hydrolase [Serratia sp. DD3]|uniref:HAD family hydrolase n=1 Tax=Serratia sp. DD3 TaxID=1410619 RepID=UPI0003C4E947|nr:HAD-IA family hydrolase [Serratia sp. DD3]KEY57916.1 phosphoglycolate phosphatase [Serratia sp. DD3]
MKTIHQFKTVVFDLDGTLLDTLPSLVNSANAVLKQAGAQTLSQAALRPALSQGLHAFFAQALALQPPQLSMTLPTAKLELKFQQRYCADALIGAPLYEGVEHMLHDLRALGISLAVCTNRDPASARTLLIQANIWSYFDVLVGLGDAARPKPAADPLWLVLEQLQCDPRQALMVGDSWADAQCAEAAGVAFAAHTYGYATHIKELQPSLWAFSHYHTLVQHLKHPMPSEVQYG